MGRAQRNPSMGGGWIVWVSAIASIHPKSRNQRGNQRGRSQLIEKKILACVDGESLAKAIKGLSHLQALNREIRSR